MEYTSADALFPELEAASAATVATRPAVSTTHRFDGGPFEHTSAKDVLAGQATNVASADGFDSSPMRVLGGGWPNAGPGRAESSKLRLRDLLEDIPVVMFATIAYQSLTKRFDSSEETFTAHSALRSLRRRYKRITSAALRNRARDLAPGGAIGVVLKSFGTGSRDDKGKHQVLVISVSLEGENWVCCCSEEQRCLGPGGCSLRSPVMAAVEEVLKAIAVDMVDLLMVLGAPVKVHRLHVGRVVLYGERTCVLRNGKTSWPFTAVRRTRRGMWVCLSCRTADGRCDHVSASVLADKERADGLGDESSDSGV